MVRGIDDVRIAALRLGAFDLGPVVGYNFGRSENDADRLQGLGDIDGGLNVGAFAGVRFASFYADAAYVTQVTGSSDLGYTVRLGACWEDQLTDRLTGNVYLSTSMHQINICRLISPFHRHSRRCRPPNFQLMTLKLSSKTSVWR